MTIIGVDIGGTKYALSVPQAGDRVEELARFVTTDVRAAPTARDMGRAAAGGDALALAVWPRGSRPARLGKALSVFIDLLNPERIVIGSIYARCEQFIAP